MRAGAPGCLAQIVLAVTVSMSVAEFAAIQQLSAADLRARFGLPAMCEPSMTALSTDPMVNAVNVVIECRQPSAQSAGPPQRVTQ
jgi:hypothetical protein